MNRVVLKAVIAQQQKEADSLNANLKQQASQIQRVSEQIAFGKI
jgi:septal ring factor EnvC (AmiA/AmiB activator)